MEPRMLPQADGRHGRFTDLLESSSATTDGSPKSLADFYSPLALRPAACRVPAAHEMDRDKTDVSRSATGDSLRRSGTGVGSRAPVESILPAPDSSSATSDHCKYRRVPGAFGSRLVSGW